MKKIYALFLLSGSAAFAQPVYESADFAAAGQLYTVNTAGNFLEMDFTTPGADQAWDFSALTSEATEETGYIDPEITGYKTSWCFFHAYFFNCDSQYASAFNLANTRSEGLAFENVGMTNIIDHMEITPSALTSKMLGVTANTGESDVPVTIDYTVPDLIYQFPIEFGQDYTTTSELSIDLNPFNFDVVATGNTVRHNEVDAWGSLITPSGTYASTLRMKTTLETEQTIVYNGETFNVDETLVTYKWFDPEFGIPVLEVNGSEATGTFVPLLVTFYGAVELGTPTPVATKLSLFPNPTSGVLNLNHATNVKSVSVRNMLGQEVGRSLDLSSLSQGIYLVDVDTDSGRITQKIVRR